MPNLALTRKFKSKILFIATGVSLDAYVTSLQAGDTATANAELATIIPSLIPVKTKDVEFSPEGDTVETEYDGLSWGAAAKQYTSDKSKITCKVPFASSGTAGTAPAYRDLLLISGFAEIIDPAVSVTYQPITSGFDYAVVAFVHDGQFHIGHMAQANAKLEANAGEIGWWNFEISMVGGTIPIPTPTGLNTVMSGYIEPKAINFSNTPVFTLGGQPFACSKFSHDTGNEVSSLDIINHQSAVIGNRKPNVTATIGAKDIATVNHYQQAWDGLLQEMVLGHGNAAGQKITTTYPSVQMGMPKTSDIEGALGYDLELTPMDNGTYPFVVVFE